MATPIDFPESNCTFTGNGDDLRDLPAMNMGNGVVVTCWALSPEEISQIKLDGHIWVMQQIGNRPLQPQLICAGDPFDDEAEADAA